MARGVLLTLGRLPKALEVARSLSDAGARVVIAEPFGLHLSRPSRSVAKSIRVAAPNHDLARYHDDLLEIVEDQAIDTIIPVSEEALYVSMLRPRLPPHCRIYGPNFATLHRLHDKLAFQRTAEAHGLAFIESHAGDDPRAAELVQSADVVVKPRHSCSGIGLSFLSRGEALPPEVRKPEVVVQRRAFGRLVSAQSVAHEGRVIGTSVYEGVVFSGTVAVQFRRVDDTPMVEDWVARFIAAERFSGFIAFDVIIDAAGGVHPLECNPRLTSGVHFFEPSALATAILAPETANAMGFRKDRIFQEGHTTLALAYAALPRLDRFASAIRGLLGARDVLWRADDPLPFLLMTPMSWDVLRKAFVEKKPLGEAATDDIVWREPIIGEAEPTAARAYAHGT